MGAFRSPVRAGVDARNSLSSVGVDRSRWSRLHLRAEGVANVALHFAPLLAHFAEEALFLAAHFHSAFEGFAARFTNPSPGLLGRAACFAARQRYGCARRRPAPRSGQAAQNPAAAT